MKNFKNIATACIAVILFASATSAQTTNSLSANEPLKVKYIGNEENFLYFQVKVDPNNANFSFLKIDDKEEGELYSQSIKANNLVQTFKIEKKQGQELNFKLFVGKNVYSKSFTTNTTIKETTIVNENDVVVL